MIVKCFVRVFMIDCNSLVFRMKFSFMMVILWVHLNFFFFIKIIVYNFVKSNKQQHD